MEVRHLIQDTEYDILQKREAYLRSTGWKHTSKSPGSYWIWVKQTEKYGQLFCSMSMALSFQFHLDSDECSPDEILEWLDEQPDCG